MSDIISEVIKIKYNSFNLAWALLSFYEHCQVKKNNFLLLYLLFPLVLNDDWIAASPIIQHRSRLESWARDNKLCIEGLPERVCAFQHLSETTLQYCIDMGYVEVDNSFNVVVKNNPFKGKNIFATSAERLTRLFGEKNPSRVYATLGIKELVLQ